jgi:hypothetical protein
LSGTLLPLPASSAVPVAQDVDSPDVDSPDVDSPDVDSPDVDSPDVDSPDVDSPDVDSPDVDSPDGAPLVDVPASDDPAGLMVSPSARAFCSTSAARDGSVLSRISLPGDGCACTQPTASREDSNQGVKDLKGFTTRFI